MGYLTGQERDFVRKLKEQGILRLFSPELTKGVTKNGGVLISCSDGDVNIHEYYREAISDRPHAIKTFGGTLNACSQFGGYDPEEERVILRNIVKGFVAKQTRTLILGHHYPCGMATEYGHGLEEVIRLNYLTHLRFSTVLKELLNKLLPPELALEEDRIFDFFHVKRINKGEEVEENMYIFDPDLYADFYLNR
jgi:hypothetical protein